MAVRAAITAEAGWYVGEDKALRFTVLDDAGDAVNISGWSLSWRFKRRMSDADANALLTKTTADGIALTTPVSGICTVSIADTDTEALGPVSGVHELKRTDAGAEAILAYGAAELLRAVHRT